MSVNKKTEFLKYTGIAFEMLATIGIFIALGLFLDKKLGLNFPIGVLAGILIGLGVSMYRITKSLS